MTRFYAIQNLDDPNLWEGVSSQATPWLGGFGDWIKYDISVPVGLRRERRLYSEDEAAAHKKRIGTDIVRVVGGFGRLVPVAEVLFRNPPDGPWGGQL